MAEQMSRFDAITPAVGASAGSGGIGSTIARRSRMNPQEYATMNRVLVITYPRKDDRIAGVMEAEYAMTNAWRDQGVIEHLFAKEADGGGVVVFNATSVEKVQALVAQLPLFPFFDKVEYFPLDKIY